MKLIFLLLLSLNIFANDFVDFFNKINSLQANFSQTIDDKDKTSGILTFQRPKSIKWQTLIPEEDILLLHNNKITSYNIWLQTAHIVDYKNNNVLVEYFTTIPKELKNIPQFVISKNQINYYDGGDIYFGFKEGNLVQIIFHNDLDNRIVIEMTNIKINPKIRQQEFIINFDENVDVI